MTMHFQKLNAQVMIVPNNDILAKTTAKLLVTAFSKILDKKERVLFIPSSGNTPLKTYQLLVKHYKHAIDWSRITIIQMDEYWSKPINENAYFYSYLQKNLVTPLGIGKCVLMKKPNGTGETELYTPKEYAHKLSSLGTIDFALHGIGRNGHIGFNEPGSAANTVTRIVNLTPETQTDNFPNLAERDTPKHGITMGLKCLCRVNHTLLIATGTQKANAVHKLLMQRDILKTPASILWNSPDFGIIVDRNAANLLV